MSKIILSGNVSLDGYIEDANGNFDFSVPEEELHLYWNEIVRETGAELMGRRLYETMEPYWTEHAKNPTGAPHTDEFAKAWVETPRYVASRTLKTADHGVGLLGPDLGAEVNRIKSEIDGDIDVGGPGLGNSLAELGLLDGFRMVVNPYIVSAGKPFMGPALAGTAWKLVEQRSFGSSVLLRYEKG
ncbi:MAG: dihydrofolate reductase family protein [Solirubrobacterales bacterium]